MDRSVADDTIDIGEVVARSGLPPSTLHLWERHGLITPAGRNGLRRQYAASVLDTLATVVLLQRASFSLDEIASMLIPGAGGLDRAVLEAKLADLEARRRQIDVAIDGVRQAIACGRPSPLDCPGFEARLDGVLPVCGADRGGAR